MDLYFIKIILAGFIYIVTPGPVFLSIITTVSEGSRGQALKLVLGAVLGCMLWLSFTGFSLIEADRLPDFVFLILTLACVFYLFWLSYRMFKSAHLKSKASVFKRPFYDGFIISLLNPKSYPVMLSVFSALVLHRSDVMEWPEFPVFFMFAVLGFSLGYGFMVTFSGFNIFVRFYQSRAAIFSYVFSIIYLGFGLNLLLGISHG